MGRERNEPKMEEGGETERMNPKPKNEEGGAVIKPKEEKPK